MNVIADVKCYHCGYVSGEVIGARRVPVREWTFEPPVGESRIVGARLRCSRCEGPVYLEDARPYDANDPVRALKRRLAATRAAATAA